MRNIHDFDFHSLSFAKVVDFLLTAFRNFVNKRRGDWTDFALPSFCIAACCCYIITCIPPEPVSNEMHINLVTFFVTMRGELDLCILTQNVEEWRKKAAFFLLPCHLVDRHSISLFLFFPGSICLFNPKIDILCLANKLHSCSLKSPVPEGNEVTCLHPPFI